MPNRLLAYCLGIAAAIGVCMPGVALATGVVFGTITDAVTHLPVAGVNVEVDGGCFGIFCAGKTTISGADGGYSVGNVESGNGAVHTACPENGCDYAPQSQTFTLADGSSNRVDVALAAAASISGTLREQATGAPVEGIIVELRNANYDLQRTSDSSGHYQFRLLPAGSYHVYTDVAASASHYFQEQVYAGHKLTPPSQGNQLQDAVTLIAGQNASGIDFALLPGATVSGTLTDRYTSAPLANVQANIDIYDAADTEDLWMYRAVNTDALGHYELGALTDAPIRFGAFVSTPYHPWSFAGCSDPCNDLTQAAVLPLTAGATQNVDLALFPGSVITGRVTRRSDGAPIANAAVSAFENSFVFGQLVFARGSTDAQGHYAIAGGMSGVEVNVEVAQAHSGTASYLSQVYHDHNCANGNCRFDGEMFLAPQYEVTPAIDFQLDAGAAISGQVVRADGGAGIAASVRLYAADGSTGEDITTAADGGFATSGLTPGTYYLSANPYGTPGYNCTVYAAGDCSQGDVTQTGTPIVISGTQDVGGIVIVVPRESIFRNGFE